MEYDKIFEECNQITPYFFIGEPRTDQKLQNGSMIGYLQTMNGKLGVIDNGMIKLEDAVNKILNDEDMSVYFVSRNVLLNYFADVIYKICMDGLQAKSNEELQSKWLNIIGTDFKQYEIFVPVYGIKVERIVNIGLFTLYNFQDCKKFLMDNKYDVTELQEYHNYEKINFLRFTFKAKGSDRAIELSRPYFELFECVVKFLLHDSHIYDIRIFNYSEIPNNANYFVFSNEDFLVTFTDGAKIPVDAEKFFNENNTAKQIFEIVTRYMNKKNTEMEKRIINAIKLVGKANINHSITDKCVQYISALETLLMHKPQDEMIVPGIANRLAECAAFIVGSINDCRDADKEKNFRQKIYSDVKRMYVVRSKIVHGNTNETYRDINVTEMRLLIEKIIFAILKNEEILKFSKIKQLYEWVDNLKFSV